MEKKHRPPQQPQQRPSKVFSGRKILYSIFRFSIGTMLMILITYLVMAGLFQTMLRNELQRNPEIIIDAIRALQSQSQNSPQDQSNQNSRADGSRLSRSTAVKNIYNKIILDKRHGYLGNPKGKKVVVEFFDYNCHYCQRQLPILQQWVGADKDVKIILVELPILGRSSVDASLFAVLTYWLANKNNRKRIATYQKFHEKILRAPRPLDKEKLRTMAKKSGWTATNISTAQQKRATDFLQNNIALANKLQIAGTPSFIYNDLLLSGFAELATLQKMTRQ